jgi:predicted DNA-binding protein (MmcQ/YjbR family)
MPPGAAFRARVASICDALPGAEVSDPWGDGHDAWKVGGKMFACIGAVTPGVAVKCPDVETAELLRDVGEAGRPPYFHASWALLPEDVPEADLRFRIERSYDTIRAGLPKSKRSALPPRKEA